ncbi:MAG: hypothetical protein ACR2PJ_03580 [Pseudomonadales bacterium]
MTNLKSLTAICVSLALMLLVGILSGCHAADDCGGYDYLVYSEYHTGCIFAPVEE